MKKVKIDVPAKINLTLDVLGLKDGYHELNSLVCTVNLCDTISLSERDDGRITLVVKGYSVGVKKSENNAYIAAKAFMKTFKTHGVNIELTKRIPIGGGMGGSSADVVGVLLGMKKLYGLDVDLYPLASSLGSDTAYMLTGGFAKMSGRGEKVEPKKVKTPLYFNALKSDESISARKCYSIFDRLGKTFIPCTDKAINSLENGDFKGFCVIAKNDLYEATKEAVSGVIESKKALEDVGAPLSIMTGSGTVVYAVYDDKKARDAHYRKLVKEHKDRLIKFDAII